jgi:hypothetical protein
VVLPLLAARVVLLLLAALAVAVAEVGEAVRCVVEKQVVATGRTLG